MEGSQLRTLLHHLHRAASAGSFGGLSDEQLLERFVRDRDEAAFEVLVWRHAPLVYNVCRRVLRRSHDVEDAFQATFLVLVRKAGSVRRRQALAGWLYRVAHRIALRARARAPREQPAEDVAAPADDAAVWRDLRGVLDEEVGRLPHKYRMAVVLCYLGGQSTEEAARRLGCPRGTVLSRLAWARERLRVRLTRRGLTLSAGLPAGLLARRGAEAAAPGVLVRTTVEAAAWVAAGKPAAGGAVSAPAVSLMEGALRAMFFAKVKATALAGLGVAVLGLAVGLWTYRPASADTRERQRVEGPAVTRGAHEGRPAKGHEPERPLGDWQRTTDECRITLHVEADHLSGTFRMADEGKSLVITARGDYSMTKDGVLYGVLTDVEIKEGREKDDEESVLFIDHPFSARYRVDGDVLIVKDLRFMEFGLEKGKEGDDFSLLLGRYKRKQPGGHADDE